MSSSAATRHPHLQTTFVETAFNSVLNPGVGSGTFGVLNGILAALLLSIGGMWLLGLGGQHLYVLLFLTVGLLASINWFSQTLIENKPAAEEGEGEQAKDVKKGKQSSSSSSSAGKKSGKSGKASKEQKQDEDEDEDDDAPPAKRTRSRSRAADEERLSSVRQTRSTSNKNKGGNEQTTTTTTTAATAAGSKKGSKKAKK